MHDDNLSIADEHLIATFLAWLREIINILHVLPPSFKSSVRLEKTAFRP